MKDKKKEKTEEDLYKEKIKKALEEALLDGKELISLIKGHYQNIFPFAQTTLKSAILINGSAAIALLAFIGNVCGLKILAQQ